MPRECRHALEATVQSPEESPPARNPIARLFWNAREQRARALVRLVCFVVLLAVGTLIFGILTVFAMMPLDQGLPLQASADTLLVTGAVATLLATFFAVWLAGRTLDRRPFADFGFHLSPAWWADLGFGLALGALLMSGIFLMERALGWVEVTGTFSTALPGQAFGQAILWPLITFACVGIYEELISRGYLLHNLAEGLNTPRLGPRGALLLAWLLSSAAFGALHARNPNATALSTAMLVIAGLFLGLGYVLSGELTIPIGLHISWNFFQGNVFGFPVSGMAPRRASFIAIEQRGPELWTGGSFGPEAGLVGLAAMLAGSLLIVLWLRAREGRLQLQATLADYAPVHRPPPDPLADESRLPTD
jgi:membrane protease YdiL (CAAX protease family)